MQAAVALVGGGTTGALLVPLLTRRGLRELQWERPLPRLLLPIAAAAGAIVVAVVATTASQRLLYVPLPAALVWSCTITALAVCDATSRRIPTAITRQGTVVVAVLLVGAGAVSGDWWPVVLAAAWAAVAAAVLHVAVLVGGVGRGDVRLAFLGGLGIGQATENSLLLGLAMWALVVAGQAAATVLRGGSRVDQIPLGPGLVIGFLTAALVTA